MKLIPYCLRTKLEKILMIYLIQKKQTKCCLFYTKDAFSDLTSVAEAYATKVPGFIPQRTLKLTRSTI